MPNIAAVYGSPRRNGNTATLLASAVEGARSAGAAVTEIVLRDIKISPCMEIYGCKESGRCVIQDDFHETARVLQEADALMIASPVFFYTVSAHLKIFMDRSQSLWVKQYWIDGKQRNNRAPLKKTLLISAGATSGKKLFDGILMTMNYFLDVYDAEIWRSLLYRGLDFSGDAAARPDYLAEAREAGSDLANVARP